MTNVFIKLVGWLIVNTVLGIMNALLISFYSPEPLPRVFLTAQLNTHTICTLIEITIYTVGVRVYERVRRGGKPLLAFVLLLALAMAAGLFGVYVGAVLSRTLLDFDPLAHEQQQFFSVIYGSILVAIVITAIDRWMRHMDQRRLQLETALQEARFKSLQYRMRPHFLFNALNTIHATLRRDPARADRALLMLAANYRFILETATNALISFDEEWDFTRNYIELEHLRFADRLKLQLDRGGDDPGLYADVRIPPLTIQPLVENAFIHGVRRSRGDGLIDLRARREGNLITVVVRDNGPGFDAPGAMNREGTLAHIRERLSHCYRRHCSFEIRRLPEGGTEAFLSFDCQATRYSI